MKRLGLVLLFLVLTSSSALGAEAVHYIYQDQDETTYDYWVSDTGVRIHTRGPSGKTLIYRTLDDELITLDPSSREAIVLGRQDIQNLMQRIQRILEHLRQLPPEQRRMMKRTMGGMLTNVRDTEAIKIPKLVDTKPTTWRDRPARRGYLTAGDDTAGTAILLNTPPISISKGERRSFRQFKGFFVDVLRLAGTVSESLDLTEIINRSQSLLGERQFRLAEFRSDDTTITLIDWNREPVPVNFFSVPEDYTTRRPSFQGSVTPGGSPPGEGQ